VDQSTGIILALRTEIIVLTLKLWSSAIFGLMLARDDEAREVLIFLGPELVLDFCEQILEKILFLDFLSDHFLSFEGMDVFDGFARQHPQRDYSSIN